MLLLHNEEPVSLDVEVSTVQHGSQRHDAYNLRAHHWQVQVLGGRRKEGEVSNWLNVLTVLVVLMSLVQTTRSVRGFCTIMLYCFQLWLLLYLGSAADLFVNSVDGRQLKVQDVGGHLGYVRLFQVPAHSLHLLQQTRLQYKSIMLLSLEADKAYDSKIGLY